MSLLKTDVNKGDKRYLECNVCCRKKYRSSKQLYGAKVEDILG